MSNIVDALKGYVTSELVSKAAGMLGEDASGITKAASGLIPTILGGLISKSADTSGFGNIFNVLKDDANEGWMDNLGSLVGGGNLAKGDPKDAAGQLMGSLFGGKVGGILDMVSSIAGIKKSSSSGILGMVGPLVMSYLGRKIRKEGLSALGLSKFLGGQSANVASALPSGLGDLMGFALGKKEEAKATVRATSERVTKTATAAATTARETVTTGGDNGGGGNKWLWPLLLAGAAAAAFYFMKGCDPEIPSVTDKMEQAADGVKDLGTAAVDGAKDLGTAAVDGAKDLGDAAADAAKGAGDVAAGAVGTVAGFFKKKLACGIEMNIPENGTEAQVVAFIDDAGKAIDKTTWFDFDRLTFASGSANLDMAKSAEQLSNIAEIMKCYPTANVKIGGYTDSDGDDAMNMKLSQSRANAVMAALTAKGVAATRMEAEGYGEAHPKASNDTAEGKAQNRRISLRLTAK